MIDSINPADIGMPPQFSGFRSTQREALSWLYSECSHQVSAMLAQTGFGKTLTALSFARILGVKTVYVVATKALQSQVYREFRSIGLADMRGRSNYNCPSYGDCESGYDNECAMSKTTKCPRNQALEVAKNSQYVVTNYACWQHMRKHDRKAFERDGEPVELLILDECHEMENQLTDFAEVKIYSSERSGLRPNPAPAASSLMDETPLNARIRLWAKERHDLLSGLDDEDEKDLADRLWRISKMQSNWCWQVDDKNNIVFLPVRVSGFTQSLFSGVSRVLMMSATLNQFMLRLLLPPDTLYDYRAWSSVFNPANSPVYHIPTRKMRWKSTDEDYEALIKQSDEIINARPDRKGIIHTVSYSRAQRTTGISVHESRIIANRTRADLTRSLDQFRATDNGVLVTPSVGTGFDFPGTAAEYQVILKFPFPNESQKVIAERCRQIPGYRLNAAAQSFVQMCGRIRRYEADRGETFVLDNSVKQLCGPEGKKFLPPGFRIFTVTKIPPAPPKLQPVSTLTT